MTVCVLSLLVASGCGSGHAARKSVSDYIYRVDEVESGLQNALGATSQVNRKLTFDDASLRDARPQLAHSEQTLRTLQKRLRALQPPPDAKRLHTLLLRMVREEIDLQHELVQVADFLPRFHAALAPLPATSRRLQSELKSRKTAAGQADAFAAFHRALKAPLRRVRALKPPPLFAPTHASELRMISGLSTTSAQLADALRGTQPTRVASLLTRFQRATVSTLGVPAQKARIAAVEDYQRREKALSKLAAEVQREQGRLQTSLP